MQDGVMLKYGRVNEKAAGDDLVPVKMAASQVVKAKSGRFVFMVAGAGTLCVASSTTIYGVLNTHEHTPTVDDKIGCDADLNGIWRIPINSGTFVEGMKGDLCDLSDSSDIQGAALDVSTRDLLIIVDGDLVNNNWVDVRMNSAKWGTGLGADA